MRISAIKQQIKNSDRASIFLDGRYSFSLTLSQLVEEKLKVGQEIDELTLSSLRKKSDDGKLKMRALEWVLLRPHSIREFKDYLRRKKADKDLVDNLTDDFLKRNYLNDQNFAAWWLERRLLKQTSNRAIEFELRGKGVDEEVISGIMKQNTVQEIDRIKARITKLKSKTRYQDKTKLKAYLVSQGYSYSLVKEALKDG